MTDTLIILPTIGANVEKAREAVAALRITRVQSEVLLVADEVELDALADAFSGLGPVRIAEICDERRGLVPAYRVGFEDFAADPQYGRLVLLEDNVLVNAGWFDVLTRTLDAHPEFGWVACGQQENANAPFTSLCSMLTRAAALALDGGPDLAFAPCQFDDGDMMMRLMAKGFAPHAVEHKVSHPQARTSREGTEADDWALIEAHRVTFMQRWGLYDFPWADVPVHRGCGECGSIQHDGR